MDTRKFVALFGTAALAVTMVGAGVSATFTDQAAGRQDVNVGVMDIQLTDITPGSYWDGQTLVCPAVFVDNAYGPGASGGPVTGCSFRVVSVGSIPPSQVTVTMSASTNGAHLDRFGITPGGFPATQSALFLNLSTASQTVGHLFGNQLPKVIDVPLTWGEYASPLSLDNQDMGKWVQVSYTFDAFS